MNETESTSRVKISPTLNKNIIIPKQSTEIKCLDENHMQFMNVMAKLFLSCWLTGQVCGVVAGGLIGLRLGLSQCDVIEQMILSFIKPVQSFVGGEKQVKLMIEFVKNPMKFCSVLLGMLTGMTLGGNAGIVMSFILYLVYGINLEGFMRWRLFIKN